MKEKRRQSIAILGSTGSIGRQALDVISQHADSFEPYALVANNSVDELIQQAKTHNPEVVVIANKNHYAALVEGLKGLPIKVFAGEESICQVAQMDTVDTVLVAMVGFSGLKPTIAAIESGKKVALANKETFVVAGSQINQLAQKYQAIILPVDSEHSAIFQSLQGEVGNDIERILLTASGGPFRNTPIEEMANITLAQALKHPNWSMGAKITIDSATMMNKGLEMIEAQWMFGVAPSAIEIVVHPQSIVHSMVEFKDKSIKAQLGTPDMRVPIQYALSYPNRLATEAPGVDWTQLSTLDFERPDFNKFPCLSLAYQAANQGGNIPCVMNAANEIAVEAFLKQRCEFRHIASIVEQTMQAASFIHTPSVEDLFLSDSEARSLALEKAKQLPKHTII